MRNSDDRLLPVESAIGPDIDQERAIVNFENDSPATLMDDLPGMGAFDDDIDPLESDQGIRFDLQFSFPLQ